jgi:hypothetical protein
MTGFCNTVRYDGPMSRPGRPATGETPMRSFRMGPVWDEARTVAKERNENLRDVIERYLRRYIAAHKGKTD